MLLVAIGYNATVQGYVGSQWSINIIRDAQLSKLFADLSVTSTKVLTRDEAAQMIYNAVDADLIEKTPSLNINTGSITYSYKANDNGKDLLSETFKVKSAKGYLTDASYDSNKKTFTYEVKDALTGGTVASSSATLHDADVLKSSTDYSELFGRTVKVLWSVAKDGTKNVYGIYASDASVAATVGELELGTATADKKVKLAGTEYKLDAVEANIDVYLFNGSAIADAGYNLSGITADNASSLTLVDSNDNGKYDYAIVVPATVAKVTYVGTKSVTAGGVYTFEDNNVYTGVAKNDYAKIVAAANSVYGKAVLTKVDSVEGKVTALKNTSDVQLNGSTWYKKVDGTVPSVGDTVKLAVVGGYYYNVEVVNGKSVDNVLMVLKAGNLTGYGIGSGVEAKVMYAKDGSVATIKISKVTNAADPAVTANATVTSADYSTAGKVLAGAMYTFVEKNGAVELTMLKNDVVGSYKFLNDTTLGFDKSATTPKVGGKVIADDAVVMVYDSTNDKTSYITGATLKSWKDDFASASQVLYSKVNGIDTAAVIALSAGAAIPGMSGNTGYGYVTADTYFIKEDDTPYAVMSIWTNDGQLTNVKAEGYGTSNTAPTAANVTSQDDFKKGAFVSFEKLADGSISKVTAIGTAYALLGTYVNKDNETELTLDPSAFVESPNSDVITRNITKDTKIVYVDTDKKTGAEGGEIALAQETAVSGTYVMNVVVEDTNSDGKLEVIFVDVNNNLASNAGSVTAATGTKIISVTEGTNHNELKIASGSTGTEVATEAAAWSGALSAVVIDNAGAVKTTGTVAATDTLRVVAEDGTAYTFVINSVA